MRRSPYVVVAVLGAVLIAESNACRAPTQAELTITTTVSCTELGDVAVVVSGAPAESERRSADRFYSAETDHCDQTRTIGTLVVTPGGSRAAILVMGAPEGKPLSACAPPLYRGCIVARRAFAFIDATTLRIPISLDVECRDVPCDAFSTCRKGVCLSSELDCSGSGCRLQGELPDGGIDKDAAVPIDGSSDALADGSGDAADGGVDSGGEGGVDGGADGGVDSGTDGAVMPPPPGTVSCSGGTMICGPTFCSSGMGCCENVLAFESLTCTTPAASPCTGMTKGRRRYCCGDGWCSGYADTPRCDSAPGTAGNCAPPL